MPDPRRVIVTGAGRNIGRAIAVRLAADGDHVAVVDLDTDAAASTVDRVESDALGPAVAFRSDVTDEESVQQLVADVISRWGGIDVLVNCVATTDRGATVLDLDLDRWRRVLDAGLTSAFICMKHVGAVMVDQGTGGAIVNVGSTSAHQGRANVIAYSAAKAGLIGLTYSAARQLGPFGIRVNLVTPNKIGSPVGSDEEPADRRRDNPLGRAGQPDDVAAAVAYLTSDAAGFVSGSELLVDGGALRAPHGGGSTR